MSKLMIRISTLRRSNIEVAHELLDMWYRLHLVPISSQYWKSTILAALMRGEILAEQPIPLLSGGDVGIDGVLPRFPSPRWNLNNDESHEIILASPAVSKSNTAVPCSHRAAG